MFAQLSTTSGKIKKVVQVGDESVGITKKVIDAFPNLFIDLSERSDYPDTTETVWYDTENNVFVTNLGETQSKPEPIPEPQLTETEQAILDTAINVDYLVCMKELEI